MQSLLRWSIENSTPLDSTPSDRLPAQRQDLNPEIIDMILGRPDAVVMKESVEVALDGSKSDDERIAALDNLEMLIEQIDNASNLENLKLWEPLQSLLTSEVSVEIKVQALWVIGTAVQNNPSAQDSYLSYNPLPTLLSFLTPSPESTTQARSKAIYALSGCLKHNAPALKLLSQPEINGWQKIKDALQDPSIGVRRKAIFLLGTLLIPTLPAQNQSPLLIGNGSSNAASPTPESSGTNLLTPDNRPTPVDAAPDPIHDNSHAANLRDASRSQTSSLTLEALNKYGILDAVISSITSPLPHGADGEHTEADNDYEEKSVRLLHTYSVACNGPFTDSQKQTLMEWVESQKAAAGGVQRLEEKWNLTSEEYSELISKL